MAKKQKKNPYPYGFDHTTGDGQKRLMAISVGQDSERWIEKPLRVTEGDYGADPLGNDMFRMFPSGDIVIQDVRNERLKRYENRKW